MLRILTSVTALLICSAAYGQGTMAFPYIDTPCVGPTAVAVADVATSPDADFDLAVTLDTTIAGDPIPLVLVELLADAEIATLEIEPGAGAIAYEAAGGIAEYSFAVGSSWAGIGVSFDPPYDSVLYGTEIAKVASVAPSEVGQYAVEYAIYTAPDECSTTGTVTVTSTAPAGLAELFIRGDVNGDSAHDVSDAVSLLAGLFSGGPVDCPDAADVNDDGALDISDAVSILTTLFSPGSAGASSSCVSDDTVDTLSICDRPSCL